MASDRTRRFSRLRPSTAAGDGSSESGDLFAHFGVPTQPLPPPETTLLAAAPVLPCPDCGWFRATPLVEPCPLCAAPPRTTQDVVDEGQPAAGNP